MTPPPGDINDFELIRRMASQAADFSGARNAWAHFYVRHQPYVLRLCTANHAYLVGAEGVRDLVQEGFLKAFGGAATFHFEESCTAEIQERKSRGWLVRIVGNLLRDRLRREPKVCIVDQSEMERLGGAAAEDPDEIQVPESERMKLLKSGLALLSETEQTVLRATMFFWQPGEEHQRMPHAALLQLSQQTGKTPENIRQIRSRAVKKLQSYVNDSLNNEKAD